MVPRPDADDRARLALLVVIRDFLAKNPKATEEQTLEWISDAIHKSPPGVEPRKAAEVLMMVL